MKQVLFHILFDKSVTFFFSPVPVKIFVNSLTVYFLFFESVYDICIYYIGNGPSKITSKVIQELKFIFHHSFKYSRFSLLVN